MPRPTTWSIEFHVREDAENIFVPAELLPHARPGDTVEVRSGQPPVSRRGRVAGPVEDETHGEFVTVTFDSA